MRSCVLCSYVRILNPALFTAPLPPYIRMLSCVCFSWKLPIVRQMRRPVSQLSPGCPLKARPEGKEVPQMACEVYIHCPLLNRLALMKCLMPGPLADIILPGSPAPWLPKKPPSLQPSLPPLHGLCCHPGRLHMGRCPLLIMLDSVRSDMQM